jgi:hypothetical protein
MTVSIDFYGRSVTPESRGVYRLAGMVYVIHSADESTPDSRVALCGDEMTQMPDYPGYRGSRDTRKVVPCRACELLGTGRLEWSVAAATGTFDASTTALLQMNAARVEPMPIPTDAEVIRAYHLAPNDQHSETR